MFPSLWFFVSSFLYYESLENLRRGPSEPGEAVHIETLVTTLHYFQEGQVSLPSVGMMVVTHMPCYPPPDTNTIGCCVASNVTNPRCVEISVTTPPCPRCPWATWSPEPTGPPLCSAASLTPGTTGCPTPARTYAVTSGWGSSTNLYHYRVCKV